MLRSARIERATKLILLSISDNEFPSFLASKFMSYSDMTLPSSKISSYQVVSLKNDLDDARSEDDAKEKSLYDMRKRGRHV